MTIIRAEMVTVDLRQKRNCIVVILAVFLQLFLCVKSFAGESEIRLSNLIGHNHVVAGVTFSPDGKWLFTSSWDDTARLWDVDTGRELRQFSGFRRSVLTSAVTSDGNQLLTAGWDNEVHLWDIKSGIERRRFRGHKAPIQSISISAAGDRLATGSGYAPADSTTDTTVRVWPMEGTEEPVILKGHTSTVVAVKFIDDGKSLISAAMDGTVRRWSILRKEQTAKIAVRSGSVTSAASSPDGKWIAVGLEGNKGGNVLIMSTDSLQIQQEFGQLGVTALAYSPDGKTLATVGTDGTLQLWNANNGSLLHSKAVAPEPVHLRAVTFSPAGDQVVASGDNGLVISMSAATLSISKVYGGHADPVSDVVLSQDRRWLATALGYRAAVWDLSNGRQIRVFSSPGSSVNKVSLSGDGAQLAAASGSMDPHSSSTQTDDVINIWAIASGQKVSTLKGHLAAVSDVGFLKDGKRLISSSEDGSVRIWDVGAASELKSFQADGEELLAVDMSPDEKRVVAATTTNAAILWDVETRKQVARLQGPASMPNALNGTVLLRMAAVCFTTDGAHVMTGSDDGFVREWSVTSGSLVRAVQTGSAVFGLSKSPDGRIIYATGANGSITTIDTASLGLKQTWLGHGAAVSSVVATDSKIVSSSNDATVRIWDSQSGSDLARLISFHNDGWAVIDAQGLFDEPDAGNGSDLYWVAGLQTLDLSQFKARYYRPGLLAQRFSQHSIPLGVDAVLRQVALGPDILLSARASEADDALLTLVDQGGGVGRVLVKVDGKLVLDDARPRDFLPSTPQILIRVDRLAEWLRPGVPNMIEVQAFNAEGTLLGPLRKFAIKRGSPADVKEKPNLWVVAIGISQYTGSDGAFDLQYAANDAKDVAKTLGIGGEALFGKGQVHIDLLSSEGPADFRPTKENIRAAFDRLKAAKWQDVVVIYFSGHGLSFNDDYYFPTEEVNSLDISDPVVREARTISGKEISEWLTISARKQAIVLDTCSAGAIVTPLGKQKSASPDLVRALERVRDRSGLYVLMGAAADKQSYEGSAFERGLVTHALLDGMRGAISLRDDQLVAVSPLFGYVKEQVEELALEVGNVQIPYVFAPLTKTEDFYVGSLDRTRRSLVPYHVKKPILLRPMLVNSQALYDNLGLSPQLATSLREESYKRGPGKAPYVYFDSPEMKGGTIVSGLYDVDGGKLNIRLVLRGGGVSSELRSSCDANSVLNCLEQTTAHVTSAVASTGEAK